MADQNKNPDSKQADGHARDSFKAKPTDKESGSTGGQKASGSGTGSGGSKPGYPAGKKDDKPDGGHGPSGESGSGKGGSTNR